MRDYKFTKEKFLGYRDKSIAFSTVEQYNQNLLEEVTKLVNDIDSEVGKLIIARDAESSKYAEKLLIGLLGHPLQAIRDQSVVMMNVLYDGVDWQRRTPFKPRIATVGSKFILEYLIEAEEGQNPNSIVLLLKSFIFDNKCK
jgi:starch synthase